jgi:large subunit ribosomal protein L9
MKVILNKDIKGIGKKLQMVEVSEGYARNYLLPKKLASIADNKSVNEAKTKNDALLFKKQTEIKEAKELKEKLEKGYIKFKHKIGNNGKLFGSITEKDIAEEIEKTYDVKVDKKKINLKIAIKELGSYTADVRLYEGIIAEVKISVGSL